MKEENYPICKICLTPVITPDREISTHFSCIAEKRACKSLVLDTKNISFNPQE